MPKVSRLRLRERGASVSVAKVVRLWTLAFGSIIHGQSLTTSATGDVRVYVVAEVVRLWIECMEQCPLRL